jgi:hypothetical protein
MHDLYAAICAIAQDRDLVSQLCPPVDPVSVIQIDHFFRIEADVHGDLVKRPPRQLAQFPKLGVKMITLVRDVKVSEEHGWIVARTAGRIISGR